MGQNNSLTFKIPKDISKEIRMFCELNEIENIDDMVLGFIKGGFAIEKFGRTPVKAGKEIIEKEVIKEIETEVEKIVEVVKIVEVEKIVEVPVEVIIEMEKVITDDSTIEEYSQQVNRLTVDNRSLTNVITRLELEIHDKKTNSLHLGVVEEQNVKLKLELTSLKEKIVEYEDVLSHFRKYSGSKTTHLKSSRLDDELYGD